MSSIEFVSAKKIVVTVTFTYSNYRSIRWTKMWLERLVYAAQKIADRGNHVKDADIDIEIDSYEDIKPEEKSDE